MTIAKRILSLTLAWVLLAAAAPVPRAEAAGAFSDAAGHWAESSILKMNLKGVLQGTGEGRFEPGRAVSRLELAVMLVRAEGLDSQARASLEVPTGVVGYQQLPSWARGYMNYAIALGLLDDEDLANFRPGDPALRYQVAVWMVRALGLETEAKQTTRLPVFVDAFAIPQWARGYVTVAAGKGLFKGDGSTTFRPLDTVTRGEIAALLDRLDGLQDNGLDNQDLVGTVDEVILGSSPRLELTLKDGRSSTLYPNQGAWVVRNGASSSFSSIRAGDRIVAVRDPAGGYGYLEADAASSRTVTGNLALWLDSGSRAITLTVSNTRVTYPLASGSVVIRRDGRLASADDLLVGDRVQLTLADEQVTEINATADSRSVTGDLAAAFPVGSGTITLSVGGSNVTYPLASTAVVVRKDGRSASNDDLWVGDRVSLTLVNDRATEINASSISRTVRGFVTSVVVSATAPAIGVTAGSAPEQVFLIPANVPIRQGTRILSISDVPLGAYMELSASGNRATTVVLSNKEYLQELSGVIIAINATRREITLAITDQPVAPSGAVRKAVRMAAGTIVVKHADVAGFANLAVGDRVMAAGATSGGVFTASAIVVTFTDQP